MSSVPPSEGIFSKITRYGAAASGAAAVLGYGASQLAKTFCPGKSLWQWATRSSTPLQKTCSLIQSAAPSIASNAAPIAVALGCAYAAYRFLNPAQENKPMPQQPALASIDFTGSATDTPPTNGVHNDEAPKDADWETIRNMNAEQLATEIEKFTSSDFKERNHQFMWFSPTAGAQSYAARLKMFVAAPAFQEVSLELKKKFLHRTLICNHFPVAIDMLRSQQFAEKLSPLDLGYVFIQCAADLRTETMEQILQLPQAGEIPGFYLLNPKIAQTNGLPYDKDPAAVVATLKTLVSSRPFANLEREKKEQFFSEAIKLNQPVDDRNKEVYNCLIELQKQVLNK